jgi:hypothetical protein
MDVLGETREVLRNDALIVLFKLTKGILVITRNFISFRVADSYSLYMDPES